MNVLFHRSFLVLVLVLTFCKHSCAQSGVADEAEKAEWDIVAKMIADKVDVTMVQADGTTALHWAAFHNQPQIVKKLITIGANVNATNTYDVSALSLACERGHAGVALTLIDADADVEAKRLGGERPLMLAARNGNKKIVNALIDAGADVEVNEVKGQTALMWAAAAGNVEAVDALVVAGAKINRSLPKSGFTAFMFAARQGKTKVIERLLNAGVDVNTVMETKRTGGRNPRKDMSALMLAIESGHLELALRLVELGANPNDQRSGYGPLHAITWVRKTKRGDDPMGDPAPRVTGSLNSIQFVRKMVEAGADVNLRVNRGSAGKAKLNPRGVTPFLLASSTADIALMKLLLELGADPLMANSDGCTALMAAAGVGVVAVGEEPGTEDEVEEAIRMLVGLGLDPNVVDDNGETATHGAAYRNFPSAVKLLTQCGADPKVWNRKNKHGWTPHLIASGKRPGSVKPSPETILALDEAMR